MRKPQTWRRDGASTTCCAEAARHHDGLSFPNLPGPCHAEWLRLFPFLRSSSLSCNLPSIGIERHAADAASTEFVIEKSCF